MSYDPKAIANYFIELARSQGCPLTPMKLQKLVYYVHGWHLAIKDSPLINEQVEAWTFGPVIPSLYRTFRHCGNQPIDRCASCLTTRMADCAEDCTIHEVFPGLEDEPEQAEFTRSLLDRIWEIYGKYTAIQLSNTTHEPDTPWHRVYTEYQGRMPKGTDIPASWIREHFRAMADQPATAR